MNNNGTMNDGKNFYLFKSMKHAHIDNAMKKGEFYYPFPKTFNDWTSGSSAQDDKYDSFSSLDAKKVLFAEVLCDTKDKYEKGQIMPLADNVIVHEQSGITKQTPICCFRIVEKDEIIYQNGEYYLAIDKETIRRIIEEFNHDSYILMDAYSYFERLSKKYHFISNSVYYGDTLKYGVASANHNYDEQIKTIAEQVFRKDKKFEWQREYRIALLSWEKPVDERDGKVFASVGSIEKIATYGKLEDLLT